MNKICQVGNYLYFISMKLSVLNKMDSECKVVLVGSPGIDFSNEMFCTNNLVASPFELSYRVGTHTGTNISLPVLPDGPFGRLGLCARQFAPKG